MWLSCCFYIHQRMAVAHQEHRYALQVPEGSDVGANQNSCQRGCKLPTVSFDRHKPSTNDLQDCKSLKMNDQECLRLPVLAHCRLHRHACSYQVCRHQSSLLHGLAAAGWLIAYCVPIPPVIISRYHVTRASHRAEASAIECDALCQPWVCTNTGTYQCLITRHGCGQAHMTCQRPAVNVYANSVWYVQDCDKGFCKKQDGLLCAWVPIPAVP